MLVCRNARHSPRPSKDDAAQGGGGQSHHPPKKGQAGRRPEPPKSLTQRTDMVRFISAMSSLILASSLRRSGNLITPAV